ncbi:MAG: arginase family protein, partial [Candidatus Methylomirabilia bacterium]
QDLRIASDSIETYSLILGRDLEDLALADLGDVELPLDAPPRAQLDRARDQILAFWAPGARLVMLGGDHTATLPVIEVIAERVPELRVLQLDAHPDTREQFLGERYNYASVMARVMEVVGAERVYQVGMRTSSREESERRGPHFYPATESSPRDAARLIQPELRRYPLYVTLDIDLLDPAEAPGTGSPEAGGLRVPEVIEVLRLFEGCEVIGMDLVEVAHAHDPSGRTGIAASSIIREAVLSWWGK